MKRTLIFILFLMLAIACSDGDLQIETIDFDDASIEFCDLQSGESETDRTLFFKIEDDEVLILELEEGLLANETSTDTIFSDLSSSTLTYRLLSQSITDDYFCSTIPEAGPQVEEEIEASSGTIAIETSLDTVTRLAKSYNHLILISDLTISNSLGERITSEPGLTYGNYSTSSESSVQEVFSNYDDTDVSSCDDTTTSTTLYKIINDELISLEVPNDFLVNEVITESRTVTLGSAVDDTTAVFTNEVYTIIVDATDFCAGSLLEDDLSNSFTTSEGTLSIDTVLSDDSTYVHTLTLTDFLLIDLHGGEVPVISSYEFGTFETTAN